MSIRRIEKISDNIMNMIIYVQSPSLEYHVKTILKDRLKVHRDFIVSADTAKSLNDAKLDSYVAPLLCDKWLIHVNADKLNKKELQDSLSKNTVHGITIYWTSKYMVYRQLIDSDQVKKQGVHCPVYSLSRLGYGDIKHLHNTMLPENKYMEQELLDYVCKNYMYDVQSVCDLFSMIRSGNEIESKKEIIEAVGVGGNTVSSLVIKILKATPKSEKGRPRILSGIIDLLDDLSVSHSHQTIRRFMLNNIDGFIDMKQLQIMGIYGRANKEIPDTYDTKRLAILRRFEGVVLNEISLPKLLNLKLCLLHYNDFDSEIALIQAISEFINNIKLVK